MTRHFTRLVTAAAVMGVTLAAVVTTSPAGATQGNRSVAAGIISTFAGGVGGPGPATTVSVGLACGVAFAPGSVYVADGPLRQVSAQTDRLTTPAGDSVQAPGPVGDGGLATKAYLGSCGTPTVDRAGNLIVPDSANARVRVVTTTS